MGLQAKNVSNPHPEQCPATNPSHNWLYSLHGEGRKKEKNGRKKNIMSQII